MVHTFFFKKITKIGYIFGKIQYAFETNIGSFQQILVIYFPFPHPGITVMWGKVGKRGEVDRN